MQKEKELVIKGDDSSLLTEYAELVKIRYKITHFLESECAAKAEIRDGVIRAEFKDGRQMGILCYNTID